MAACDEQDIMPARILQYLWHVKCPECGFVGTHDGDCSRDWRLPGRGLFGDAPPFRGTELLGLTLLAKAILARKTTQRTGVAVVAREAEQENRRRRAGEPTPSAVVSIPSSGGEGRREARKNRQTRNKEERTRGGTKTHRNTRTEA